MDTIISSIITGVEERHTYSVYMHVCPNGKRYIGLTGVEPKLRWGNGNNYSGNKHFTGAIRKYGWNNITHTILVEGLTLEQAREFEKFYIQFYGTKDQSRGYNLTDGGEGTYGYVPTEETRRKLSEAGKGRHPSPETHEKMLKARRRQIDVYDMNLKFLYSCDSIEEARFKTGVNSSGITNTCKGIYKQSGGYVFRYKGDNPPTEKPRSHRHPVNQYTLDGKFICQWGTIKEASRQLGICDEGISECCKKIQKQSGGFHWEYA